MASGRWFSDLTLSVFAPKGLGFRVTNHNRAA